MAITIKVQKALARYNFLTKPMRAILTDTPHKAFLYAKQVISKPFPEGEASIATDPDWAYMYTYNILNKPFPAGEAAIATDPDWAYMYAVNILKKKPFPAAEAVIKTSDVAVAYAKECLGLSDAKAQAWANS